MSSGEKSGSRSITSTPSASRNTSPVFNSNPGQFAAAEWCSSTVADDPLFNSYLITQPIEAPIARKVSSKLLDSNGRYVRDKSDVPDWLEGSLPEDLISI